MGFEFGDQFRDVSRIVLTVGIEGDNGAPRRFAKANPKGGALPGIGNQREHTKFRNRGGQGFENLQGLVAGAIVDRQHLPAIVLCPEHPCELM